MRQHIRICLHHLTLSCRGEDEIRLGRVKFLLNDFFLPLLLADVLQQLVNVFVSLIERL